MKALLALLPVLLLSACVTSGSCGGDQEYQQAQTLPPPQKVEGVKPLDSPAALRIPAEPATKTPFAEVYQDPRDLANYRTRCLDTPPRVPDPEPAPEPAPAKS